MALGLGLRLRAWGEGDDEGDRRRGSKKLAHLAGLLLPICGGH